jgi:hypothetical protein
MEYPGKYIELPVELNPAVDEIQSLPVACPVCEGEKFFPQHGFNCSGKIVELAKTHCYMCGGTGILPKPIFKIDLTGMKK